ncbi:hypothetical protein A2U01_0075358, partial [Trifolium medium]|nr:hypothetical protein [Trifolium medium]
DWDGGERRDCHNKTAAEQ